MDQSTLETRISALDDQLYALRNAPDEIETQGENGSKVRVKRDEQQKFLMKLRAQLVAQLSAKRGDSPMEAARTGFDVARATENGDLP